jgi:hypothetical protein
MLRLQQSFDTRDRSLNLTDPGIPRATWDHGSRVGAVFEKWITRQQPGLVRRAKTSRRSPLISLGLLWWQIRCVQAGRSV